MAVHRQMRRQVFRVLRVAALASLGAILAAQAQSATSDVRLQRSTPAGFEQLAAQRRLQVSVLFNKVEIGKAAVEVDLESIIFDDPAAVAALIPNLADRSQVTAALTGPLPLHAGLACRENVRRGCGQLAPDVAGVIYDSSSEAVQLFVNPALRIWSASLARLQPQASEPALLGKLHLNVNHQSTLDEPRYLLGLNTVAGLGATHLRTEGLLRNERADLQQLHLRHVTEGHERLAGLFNAANGAFMPPERLLGIRLGTTLDDLPADAGAYDVPVVVALAGPATIDASVGDRLLAAARFPAGEARIDTSNFPTGAYLVKLRIVEAGRERIEERFFARSSAFPPLGAAQTSMSLGVRYPDTGFVAAGFERGAPALQLSHRRRLAQNIGFGGSLHAREDGVAAEAELALSWDGVQWSNSILGARSGELAYASSLRLQTGKWRVFGDVRRVSSADAASAADRFLSFKDSFWQTTLSAGRRLGPAQLQAAALWRRAASGAEQWSLQPALDLPLRVAGYGFGVRLTGDFGPGRSAVRLELSMSGAGRNVSARAGAQLRDDAGRTSFSPVYEAGIADQWRCTPESQLRTDLTWRQDDRENLTGSTQLSSSRGSMFLSMQSDVESHQHSYLGNVQSGFTWTRAGLSLTTGAAGDAAVIYVNNSRSETAVADALLSNARIGTLQPREARAQPVAAFRRSVVGMLPARGASLSGSSPNRAATLFPGTVVIVANDFVQVSAAFGQLVDANGVPIANAVLSGAHGVGESDTYGYFQLDFSARETISVRRADGTNCRFELAVVTSDAALFDAGRSICR
jgi:Mat/Ecp fimbriae outer membrane usher protein